MNQAAYDFYNRGDLVRRLAEARRWTIKIANRKTWSGEQLAAKAVQEVNGWQKMAKDLEKRIRDMIEWLQEIKPDHPEIVLLEALLQDKE